MGVLIRDVSLLAQSLLACISLIKRPRAKLFPFLAISHGSQSFPKVWIKSERSREIRGWFDMEWPYTVLNKPLQCFSSQFILHCALIQVLLLIYTQTQKKLTTCLKCNKIVTVQNKTNQQLLIETLAFYWWHVKCLTTINQYITAEGAKSVPLSIACVATIVLDTGSASSANTAYQSFGLIAAVDPLTISRHQVQLIKIIPYPLANHWQSKQLFNSCAMKWPLKVQVTMRDRFVWQWGHYCPQISSHIYYTPCYCWYLQV